MIDLLDLSAEYLNFLISSFFFYILEFFVALEFDTFILSSRVYNRNAIFKIFSANVSYNQSKELSYAILNDKQSFTLPA